MNFPDGTPKRGGGRFFCWVWMLANIGALFMDEKFCLQADFADEYRKYQQSTPMLIPNRVSIARFRTDVKNRVMRKKSAPEYRGGIK